MTENQLDGIWRVCSYVEGGRSRSQTDVAKMARLVLIPDENSTTGIWAVVTVGYQGGVWPAEKIRRFVQRRILGPELTPSEKSTDFYLWAGGRFCTVFDVTPQKIDFEQNYLGEVVGHCQMGIFCLDSEHLSICVRYQGSPRPKDFEWDGDPEWGLTSYIREVAD